MTFLQPDSSTCVPTTFAYLAYLQCKLDYELLLPKLLITCSSRYNLPQNGMSFQELEGVVKELGFEVNVTSTKPSQPLYLVGVQSLPLCKYVPSQVITESEADGSLVITKTLFKYPAGHAVCVKEEGEKAVVYDSFLGTERVLALSEVLTSLEDKPEFLEITHCAVI